VHFWAEKPVIILFAYFSLYFAYLPGFEGNYPRNEALAHYFFLVPGLGEG
jgi:hypothetical protein